MVSGPESIGESGVIDRNPKFVNGEYIPPSMMGKELSPKSPENPYQKKIEERVDIARWIIARTQVLGNRMLGELLESMGYNSVQKLKNGFLYFDGKEFQRLGPDSDVLRNLGKEDRIAVDSEGTVIVARYARYSPQLRDLSLRSFEDDKEGLREKTLLFQEQVRKTLALTNRKPYTLTQEYRLLLKSSLTILLHDPKNGELSVSQFDDLCTEVRFFYTRKMFSQMTGEQYQETRNTLQEKGLDLVIGKKRGDILHNPYFGDMKISASSVPNPKFTWNIKNRGDRDGENMQMVNIPEFIREKNLKTYHEYLNAIEVRFKIPHNLLYAICWHESKGDPFAVSRSMPTGARGIFQMKPIVTNNHDDKIPQFHGSVNPYDIYGSAFRAAEKLTEEYYGKGNRDWKSAIGWYNGDSRSSVRNKYIQDVIRQYKKLTGDILQL